MDKFEMSSLIKWLNDRTTEYDAGHPTVSDQEWDNKYWELVEMEAKTGIIFANSPTQKIHYEIISELKKVEHNHKMLSLDKTKDWNEFINYFGNKDVIGMPKLDGLTCSLEYLDGKLVKAETRGNGLVGEDVLHNAKVISSIPKNIPYKNTFIVDGEIICTDNDFKEFANNFANSRNFASGSIRLLDSKECAKRKLTFVVWNIVKGFDNENSFMERLEATSKLGFLIIPWTSSFDLDAKEFLIDEAKKLGYPIDGLVGRFDDIAYGENLGETDHHSRAAYAFKFHDETYPTRLKYIKWNMGRTGVLTPVAIFDPIEIEGSIVEKASLHNVSIMREILGDCAYVGEPLQVYKANMIIPQIAEAGPKYNYGYVVANGGVSANDCPEFCPICHGGVSYVKSNDGTINLYCDNPTCEGKLVNRLDHFCGKKGLDIKGLSKKTLEKLVEWGWINELLDIFKLDRYKTEWISKTGFGITSVEKILKTINNSKQRVQLSAFISAIGIPLIGSTVAKEIVKYYPTWEEFKNAVGGSWSDLDGFGQEMEAAINNFDYSEADEISKYLTFESSVVNNKVINNTLEGKTVVITGKLTNFKNRNELKEVIIAHGGKVTNSITSKTDILINNDINSSSSKNKAAKDRGIPIISETDFISQYLEN